ncbi:hypothetical protein AQUCO_00300087v1 [Aquilegia coerulea]|uniref:RHOMBOID-like protein n=1 Tax=Aquilegia coerulea TaxID=218851 RepID=A0A2G5EX87_AQUCA|nr:hypothetical protein AQUCO_00300087v1 [Aquilegia coerulea]
MGGSPPSDRNQPRRGDNSIHPVTIDSSSSSSAVQSAGDGRGFRSTSRNYQRNQPFKSWFPWLIPSFFIANVVLFIISMYVNNCPKNSINCVADFLGRFSFQPMKENPLLGPSSTTLDKMGAQQVSKVVDGHQAWRLITAIWLHAGVFHLLANMLSLLFIGIRLEQEFGFVRIGLLYLISGFGGNVLSALFIKDSIAVGASGALFGLLGAMLSELITNWTIYANKLAALLTLLFIIVINLAVGILPHVDNYAHIGGFLTGLLLGFVFLMRPQFGWVSPKNVPPGYVRSSKPKYKMYQIILLVAALILLIVGFSVGLVMLFRGVNGNDHCSWCHYLSCIPTSKWKCKTEPTYCMSTQNANELILSCQGNGKNHTYAIASATESQIKGLCLELCS